MVNIKHHEISLWCHYNGPKLCSLHHFRPLMSWTLSHCRSRTISDHYRPEFPDKTLSIDFLSFNILIRNEQLATNKQLKKHPLNICTYRLLYLPFVVIFLRWLMYHTHDAGPLSWVDVTECPRSAVGWRETGENCESYLTLCIDFCESEYYSYNDWAGFLGTMELAAAAETLLHWAWIIHETITLLLSVAECKASWHMHKGQGSNKIIVLSDNQT